ncbi:hypothetical protein AK812_SmicGene35318 [Symbiodinium microadriaticum]|uniref:Uncharacterized protein n=1 Tax=Symbiodinium microadriaticum TaxID=2951 RepID=A0A1Q9CLW8_SYMMI|nr:hypothetical protein AK812_SmicGene35318 [Symbiodinium microadriaticum]CAE7644767.1 unnamed protein product [Symbiodinium microadriaticum]
MLSANNKAKRFAWVLAAKCAQESSFQPAVAEAMASFAVSNPRQKHNGIRGTADRSGWLQGQRRRRQPQRQQRWAEESWPHWAKVPWRRPEWRAVEGGAGGNSVDDPGLATDSTTSRPSKTTNVQTLNGMQESVLEALQARKVLPKKAYKFVS